MKITRYTGLNGAMIVALALSGCAVSEHIVAVDSLKKDNAKVDAKASDTFTSVVTSRVSEVNGMWVNKKSVSVREEHLPAAFRSELGISYESKMSLRSLAGLISRETGMRITFAGDVTKEADAALLQPGVYVKTDLRSLLDRVTAQADMSWRYTEGSIEIYRFDTKIFSIAALPGETTLNATLSNKNSGGNGSSATANAGQDSKYTAKLDFWSGLKNDLKNLLPSTSTYSVSDTNQTVTVTGTPAVLSSVESYIKSVNAKRKVQIILVVHAYKVDVESGRDFGMSLSSVFTDIANKYGITMTNPVSTNTASSVLTATMSSDASSKFAGSKVILNALNTVGRTTVTAENTQMVLAGESASVNSLREITYLAEVTSTPNANAAPSVALKPGVVTEGFALTLTPSVSDDYVLIGGSIDLSTIDSLQIQESGGQKITTPNRTTGSQMIRMAMKSGETYIYALRQNNASSADSGTLSESLFATPFGGSHNSKSANKTLVITITPYIVKPKTT